MAQVRPLRTMWHREPHGSEGPQNVRTTKICCKFFQTVFHSSEKNTVFRIPVMPFGSNFTNNCKGASNCQVTGGEPDSLSMPLLPFTLPYLYTVSILNMAHGITYMQYISCTPSYCQITPVFLAYIQFYTFSRK